MQLLHVTSNYTMFVHIIVDDDYLATDNVQTWFPNDGKPSRLGKKLFYTVFKLDIILLGHVILKYIYTTRNPLIMLLIWCSPISCKVFLSFEWKLTCQHFHDRHPCMSWKCRKINLHSGLLTLITINWQCRKINLHSFYVLFPLFLFVVLVV